MRLVKASPAVVHLSVEKNYDLKEHTGRVYLKAGRRLAPRAAPSPNSVRASKLLTLPAYLPLAVLGF